MKVQVSSSVTPPRLKNKNRLRCCFSAFSSYLKMKPGPDVAVSRSTWLRREYWQSEMSEPLVLHPLLPILRVIFKVKTVSGIADHVTCTNKTRTSLNCQKKPKNLLNCIEYKSTCSQSLETNNNSNHFWTSCHSQYPPRHNHTPIIQHYHSAHSMSSCSGSFNGFLLHLLTFLLTYLRCLFLFLSFSARFSWHLFAPTPAHTLTRQQHHTEMCTHFCTVSVFFSCLLSYLLTSCLSLLPSLPKPLLFISFRLPIIWLFAIYTMSIYHPSHTCLARDCKGDMIYQFHLQKEYLPTPTLFYLGNGVHTFLAQYFCTKNPYSNHMESV